MAVHGLHGDREKSWSPALAEEYLDKSTFKIRGREYTTIPNSFFEEACAGDFSLDTSEVIHKYSKETSGNRIPKLGQKGDQSDTKIEKKLSWLKDLLPTYIPDTRVSTYGYALGQDGISSTNIDEKAKELLNALCDVKSGETVSLSLVM